MMGMFEFFIMGVTSFRDFFNSGLIAPSLLFAWTFVKADFKHILTFPIVLGIASNLIPSYEKIREISSLNDYYNNQNKEEIVSNINSVNKLAKLNKKSGIKKNG